LEVHKVSVKNLEAWFGTKQALKNINLDVKEKTVTAFIGPSGCGKTTLIRCLNRMHEMTPDGKAKGRVMMELIFMIKLSILLLSKDVLEWYFKNQTRFPP
jgi:phosphate transport system ATP-binding protein